MTNEDIARELREEASQLARQGNNLYRIRSFRQAAMAVLALTDEVASILARDGTKGLEQVPGIGKRLATRIAQFAAIGMRPEGSPIPECRIATAQP